MNVDIDIFFGPPEVGNGAPSDAFGAAASQHGRWNRVSIGQGPHPLLDLEGNNTLATLAVTGSSAGGGGVGFAGNTGDHALLLNDAAWVGTTVQGGSLTYKFFDLLPGEYDIFTYAVNIGGNATSTPVFVPLATSAPTQIVTGPMPGNSFEYLVTHSIHRVTVSGGAPVEIIINQLPNLSQSFSINGFQLRPVPEIDSGTLVTLLLAALLICKARTNRS